VRAGASRGVSDGSPRPAVAADRGQERPGGRLEPRAGVGAGRFERLRGRHRLGDHPRTAAQLGCGDENAYPSIRRTRARISAVVPGRPACRRRYFQVQYFRNPCRCHRTTVLGWMTTRTSFHRGQKRRSVTQKNRSTARILGRGRLAVRMANCRRRARFSIRRSDCDAATRRSQTRVTAIQGNIAPR